MVEKKDTCSSCNKIVANLEGTTRFACPNCGKKLVIKTSKAKGNKFLACPGYPDCKHAESL